MTHSLPLILLTNDDGIHAEGLHALEQALSAVGQVFTVAPMDERSGASHSISVRRELRYTEMGERRWALDGTPADCVIAALSHLMSVPPALVVSGINHGGNLGRNIHYSGTVGAAAEATLNGVPAIAMSLCSRPPVDFGPAAALAARLATRILGKGLPEGGLLNVNVPAAWNNGVRLTRPYRRHHRAMLAKPPAGIATNPDGEGFWVREQIDRSNPPADSDLRAIEELAASVSLVQVYPAAETVVVDLEWLLMQEVS